ncbi:GNAT family N-acetyltransferase [Kurthia gibsonii]|uniref:GNAT family N-acetyltransferase n=1 Tax=Kurthia gibsonii TaxID=33946 RepID=UPI0013EF3622|nr:GNAT family N-acetyltransferase [Kurthia gibsonii]
MEIRQIKDNEKALVQDLRDYSFTSVYKGEKLEDFQYWLENCHVLGGFIEGELAGQVFIFPLNMTLRNQNHAMGGIGFVATDPIFRNRGVMKQLMIASLVQMRENKQVISVLAPYSVSFYRYFGWELFNDILHFEIQEKQFPQTARNQDVVKRMSFQKVDSTILKEVQEFHNRYAEKTEGCMKRTSAWWSRIIKRQLDGHIAVFYESNRVAGYIRYDIRDLCFTIHDYYSENYSVEEAIWRYVFSHASSIDKVRGVVSIEQRFMLSFAEPQIKQQRKQETMLRIVDVYAFFTQLTLPKDMSFYIQVLDTFAPWNEGVFHIHKGSVEKVIIKPTTRILTISIQHLASLVAGYETIEQLLYRQCVQVDGEIISEINQLFPKSNCFFNEYF